MYRLLALAQPNFEQPSNSVFVGSVAALLSRVEHHTIVFKCTAVAELCKLHISISKELWLLQGKYFDY